MAKNKNVITIPATRQQFTSAPINEQRKRRVAAYARVSTDHEDQQNSYEAQIDYYTGYITGREDWEFVKVYADEGITGTSTRHRLGFQEMVADALDGKIDLIVTKSVSRFARNTVDSLTTIRELKDKGVECYFEKEQIWTFDGKGELMLTIMSSLAQEEARSISENCTWGQRKRIADGKVSIPFGHFLGFKRGPNGEILVDEEQAVTVRRIYSMFLQGMTPCGIAKQLTADGIKSPGGKDKWSQSTVKSILQNEKYKGDALLQKTFTTDFLTKKQKINEGEVPQFYVENNHEAIVEPAVFDMVQREIARRNPGRNRHSGVHIFSGKIKCGQCGSWYGSKVWHSNSKYRRIIWQCNHKYDNDEKCTTPHLTDGEIEQFCVSAINKLLERRDSVRADYEEVKPMLFDTSALETKQEELREETQLVADLVQQCIRENASVALDQNDYQKRYDALVARYNKANDRLEAVTAEINDKELRKATIEDCLAAMEKLPTALDAFDETAFHSLVDYITVYSNDDVRVTFKDGTEIQA